ncbi:MAG: hypothetical protein LC798_12940 [Chloroflexi bacterium]|nr:hypothetical protein [Chloroflexota bacterium]
MPNGQTHTYDDGGRAAAGYKSEAGDCVTRAIAIATGLSYQEVYDTLGAFSKALEGAKGKTARDGVRRKVYDTLLEGLGWEWTPTMGIGTGCQVHLRADELPSGRLIVRLSKHLAAVIDGVLYDTHDCSRGGTRCVYGYWSEPATEGET